MRFPKIDEVAAELRAINKYDTDEDGIDVRLQVYPDGEWAVRSGLSDYDQDHRGFWGSSSVPGSNRRFDSKDVARDLIDQAKESRAQGGDELEERGSTGTMEIEIPDMKMWQQIGGDMNPGAHGGLIARTDGDALELLEIQPVREFVGDDEAADIGFPFWTKEAYFTLDDLDPSNKDVQSALRYIGMDMSTLEEDFSPTQRALVIAEALVAYGSADEGTGGWSADIIHDKVKWSTGEIAGAEYLADEDEDFRRDVLGEEDEDEENDEDEYEEQE